VTYNGSPVAPFAPGTYAVSAVVQDPNFAGTANATLVIGNRGFTIDVTGWTSTSSTLSDADTSSPLWNPGNATSGLNGSAHAFFDPIQLTGMGDALKLTGTVAIAVNNNSRTRPEQGTLVRLGLFRNQTPVTPPTAPVTTNWLGYCGMVNSSAALYERTGTGAYGSSITGATTRPPQTSLAGANSTQNSITLRFTETITRTATGIDVSYEAVNTATLAKVMSFTYSDTTPNNNGLLGSAQDTPTNPVASPTFSAVGFGFSGEYIGNSNASAQFTNVQASYSSPSPGTAQTITFPQIADQVYGAPTIPLAAISSSSLPVSYSIVSGQATLSGNSLTITGVGEITVRASQGGNIDYLPATPVEQTFTARKAQATVTLSNLSHTHDGFVKSATATTDPANLTINIRYNGEQTAPYQIGSYEVTAVITDDKHEGAASATLVINASHTAVENWRFTHFETHENSGDAANSADPDSDGIKNLMEFALGLNPKSPSIIPATLEVVGASMQFTYTRLTEALTELDFSVEQCADLSTNTWTTTGVGAPSPPFADDGTRHSVTVTIPATGNRRFIRLKATPKQP
jgi:hypothetical protein